MESQAKSVKVGMLGLGTVGKGVAELLLNKREQLASKWSTPVALSKIVTRRPSLSPFGQDEVAVSDNFNDILDDPEIGIVVELIGGIEPARTYVLEAIAKGKSVVTANKALLSLHGEEIFSAASKSRVGVMFEATVAGAIPIIRSLSKSLVSDEILSLRGILNGTTNYILTKMTEEGMAYDDALEDATAKGFAEADPAADVEGWDSRDKLVILLRLAFGSVYAPQELFCEGITNLSPLDIEYARELGYTIKLLAIARRNRDGIEARVHPALVPADSLLANVRDEYNAVELVGKGVGTQMYFGKGAGQMPTATVVVSDIVALAERVSAGIPPTLSQWLDRGESLRLIPHDELTLRYYLRLEVVDKVGVLEEITHVLAQESMSLEAVQQKSRGGETVPLVILTHEAKEAAVRRAIDQLNAMEAVRSPVQMVRIEDV